MHNVSIAEWIVGRFTSAAEAASIAGDLEEQRARKGILWFWASLAGFLFRICWRRFAALIVASRLGVQVLEVSPFILRRVSHYQHRDVALILYIAVFAAGALLGMMFLYSLIRYGIRDRATQLAFLWAAVFAAIAVSWEHPVILFFCIALSVGLSFLSLANIKDRRRTLALAAAIATAFASFVFASLLIQHHSSSWLPFTTAFFSVWLPTEIWSRLHDRAASLEENEDAEDSNRASLG
jgi:hypothetical protein